jgi:sec-independent protein translocase protein TatC
MTEPAGRSMSFLEHLEELRKRLWWGIAFVVAGIVIGYAFKNYLMSFMLVPFQEAWETVKLNGAQLPAEPMIHYRSMQEPFFTDLMIALIGGIYVGLPLLAWQIWLFVAPGLLPREKTYAMPFLVFSYVFFTGGMAFCYWVVLPMAYSFFFTYASSMNPGVAVNPTVMINDYVTFSVKMLGAFGFAFELPLFVAFLTLLRIVDWRMLVKYIRWGVLGTVVAGALLTPPDPASQLMMAAPLLGLYVLSIGISFAIWPAGHKPVAGGAGKRSPGKAGKSSDKTEK